MILGSARGCLTRGGNGIDRRQIPIEPDVDDAATHRHDRAEIRRAGFELTTGFDADALDEARFFVSQVQPAAGDLAEGGPPTALCC